MKKFKLSIISVAFNVVECCQDKKARNEGILDGLNVLFIGIDMRKPAKEFGHL